RTTRSGPPAGSATRRQTLARPSRLALTETMPGVSSRPKSRRRASTTTGAAPAGRWGAVTEEWYRPSRAAGAPIGGEGVTVCGSVAAGPIGAAPVSYQTGAARIAALPEGFLQQVGGGALAAGELD